MDHNSEINNFTFAAKCENDMILTSPQTAPLVIGDGIMKRNQQDQSYSLSEYLQKQPLIISVETLVLQTLREAITKGAFYPGQAIDENQVASELQVSRMPVRQAISALEIEGLVTKVPRKGTFVTSLDKEDIREIYTTRIALEELAIVEAVKHYTDADFEKIEHNLEATADQIESYQHFLEIDKEFHQLLYAPSGWNRLTRMIIQLRNNTAMYRWLKAEFPRERIEKSLRDHREITEACKRRDAVESARLLRLHTQNTILSIDDLKTNEL